MTQICVGDHVTAPLNELRAIIMSLYIMQSKHYRWSHLICLFACLKWKQSDVNPAEVSPDYSRVLIIARKKKGKLTSVSEEEVLHQVFKDESRSLVDFARLRGSLLSLPPFFKNVFTLSS